MEDGMAYRSEMTIDEQIIHHSWESYYAACFACQLHDRAESLKARTEWPNIDNMPLPVAMDAIGMMPGLVDSVGKLADAGIVMATKYTNLINESIQRTAKAWGVIA